MALGKKKGCEGCLGRLPHMSQAFIFSRECTFRPKCAGSMDATCPNCGGESTWRPNR